MMNIRREGAGSELSGGSMPAMEQGFQEVQSEEISEVNGKATLLKHLKSGADLIIIENDDDNKLFSIYFRTVPSDSTGVAHILEHSVLCGSERYPLKEPFVEILKGSMNTFANATTSSDRTFYPLASTNGPDFLNQVGVYLDAALNPLLKEETFLQAGWRFEVDYEGNLTYNGVVYSEMKGALSDPMRVLYEEVANSLFPDTLYGLNSGGDPKEIPELTFEAFKAFHARHYHPSNSCIIVSGNFDRKSALALLNERLSAFTAKDIDIEIPAPTPFSEPVKKTAYYAASEGEDKCFVTTNWLLGEIKDPVEKMGIDILDHILLMMPSSPLKRAVIESGLGEGIALYGLDDAQKQPMFQFGLKGVKDENCDKVVDLIYQTLRSLSEEGISPDDVAAAINEVEFKRRENNTGIYPQAFTYMQKAARHWLDGRDPLKGLKFEEALAGLKEKLQTDPEYFQSMLKRYFLDNKHHSVILLKPDSEKAARDQQEEGTRMSAVKNSLEEADLEAIREKQAAVKAYQEEQDSPEALATIPRLGLSELPHKVNKLAVSVQQEKGIDALHCELFTGGIVYADIGLDLSRVPEALLPYAGIFGKLCTELGTRQEDYVAFNRKISAKTGGISSRLVFDRVVGSSKSVSRLFLEGKAMAERSEDLFSLMGTAVTELNLDNRDRLRQIVLESKTEMERGLLQEGYNYIFRRLASHLHPEGASGEAAMGVRQLLFLRELAERIDSDWSGVREELESFKNSVMTTSGLVTGLTSAGDERVRAEHFLGQLIDRLPAGATSAFEKRALTESGAEGLIVPSKVNYVGKGIVLPGVENGYSGATAVVLKYLRRTHLWDEVRVKGGAYGGFPRFDPWSGELVFTSYRDPNLMKTLEVYDRVSEHLANLSISDEELQKLQIGTISDLDRHLLPDAKGRREMTRHLIGMTDQVRQQYRDGVFAATAEDFRDFGRKMAALKDKGQIVVMGSQESIEELANQVDDVKKIQVL